MCTSETAMATERFADVMLELRSMLPLSPATQAALDDDAIMRTADLYLDIRTVVQSVEERLAYSRYLSSGIDLEVPFSVTDIFEALNGLLLMLRDDGTFLYVSGDVENYFGFSACQLLGSNIKEYIHIDDAREITTKLKYKDICSLENKDAPYFGAEFFIRVKHVVYDNEESTHCYKMIHCSGHIDPYRSEYGETPEDNNNEKRYFLGVGYLVPESIVMHFNQVISMFYFHCSLSLKPFTVQKCAQRLTGYRPQDFESCSLYHFVHAADVVNLREAHQEVLSKGHSLTGYYRFLLRTGGWIWIQTEFSHASYGRGRMSDFIVAINYVLSEVECPSDLMAVPPSLATRPLETETPRNYEPVTAPQPRRRRMSRNKKDAAEVEFIGARVVNPNVTVNNRRRWRAMSEPASESVYRSRQRIKQETPMPTSPTVHYRQKSGGFGTRHTLHYKELSPNPHYSYREEPLQATISNSADMRNMYTYRRSISQGCVPQPYFSTRNRWSPNVAPPHTYSRPPPPQYLRLPPVTSIPMRNGRPTLGSFATSTDNFSGGTVQENCIDLTASDKEPSPCNPTPAPSVTSSSAQINREIASFTNILDPSPSRGIWMPQQPSNVNRDFVPTNSGAQFNMPQSALYSSTKQTAASRLQPRAHFPLEYNNPTFMPSNVPGTSQLTGRSFLLQDPRFRFPQAVSSDDHLNSKVHMAQQISTDNLAANLRRIKQASDPDKHYGWPVLPGESQTIHNNLSKLSSAATPLQPVSFRNWPVTSSAHQTPDHLQRRAGLNQGSFVPAISNNGPEQYRFLSSFSENDKKEEIMDLCKRQSLVPQNVRSSFTGDSKMTTEGAYFKGHETGAANRPLSNATTAQTWINNSPVASVRPYNQFSVPDYGGRMDRSSWMNNSLARNQEYQIPNTSNRTNVTLPDPSGRGSSMLYNNTDQSALGASHSWTAGSRSSSAPSPRYGMAQGSQYFADEPSRIGTMSNRQGVYSRENYRYRHYSGNQAMATGCFNSETETKVQMKAETEGYPRASNNYRSVQNISESSMSPEDFSRIMRYLAEGTDDTNF